MIAQNNHSSNVFEINPIEMQPEFPLVDLTDTNANQLELILAHWGHRNTYHNAAELIFVFRALHPTIEAGVSTTNDGQTVNALSHGMMIFEAINVAVTSPLPAKIGNTATTHLVSLRESVSLMTDMSKTREASDKFQAELPNAARVVRAASERSFGELTYKVVAGAGLERQLTIGALNIQMQLDHEYPQIEIK